jgi:hypothetical protein
MNSVASTTGESAAEYKGVPLTTEWVRWDEEDKQ